MIKTEEDLKICLKDNKFILSDGKAVYMVYAEKDYWVDGKLHIKKAVEVDQDFVDKVIPLINELHFLFCTVGFKGLKKIEIE